MANQVYFERGRDGNKYFHIGKNDATAHFHRSVEIVYVLQGEKTAFLNGKKYVAREGQGFLIPPWTVHAFPMDGDTQIVAVIPNEYCSRFERLCEKFQPVTPLFNDADGRIKELLLHLGKAENEFIFEGLVGEIVGQFVKRTEFLPAERKSDKLPVEKIAEFVDENYAKSCSLTVLAEKFGYSPNYFSALFKRYFGTGIAQYVNLVRVQKSVPLLKTYKISAVYAYCGFESPQQYFLNFKKVFGCTPSEYLRRNLPVEREKEENDERI